MIELNYETCLPNTYAVTVAIHQDTLDDEPNGYWVEVLGLSGCVSEGETIEECLVMIRDAFIGCAQSYLRNGPIPFQKFERPLFCEIRRLTVHVQETEGIP